MAAARRKHISNKWRRHKILIQRRSLRKYVPETGLLSRNKMERFLDRYSSIFVKPVYGLKGRGVIKISHKKGSFQVRTGKRKMMCSSWKKAYQLVKQLSHNRKMLIQRGIHLLKINRRPLDFRVLLSKPGRKWKVVGIAGKMAASQKIVTNIGNGGKVLRVRHAVVDRLGFSPSYYTGLKHKLYSLGRRVAHTYGRRHAKITRIGLDVAVDRKLRPWILEVNTSPCMHMFSKKR